MTNILTKTLRSSFLILAFSLFINTASAQNCATPPSCEQLGYVFTTEICKEVMALKCPFDQSKVYCTPKCLVGDYVYSDGSCYRSPNPDKTLKGIVLDSVKRIIWDKSSIITGIAGGFTYTWEEANAICAGYGGSRLGSKEELEIWASYFPASKTNVPVISQVVWTSSSNEASTAWMYKVKVGEAILDKRVAAKTDKSGTFCVVNF